jgi:hypothetical protein
MQTKTPLFTGLCGLVVVMANIAMAQFSVAQALPGSGLVQSLPALAQTTPSTRLDEVVIVGTDNDIYLEYVRSGISAFAGSLLSNVSLEETKREIEAWGFSAKYRLNCE